MTFNFYEKEDRRTRRGMFFDLPFANTLNLKCYFSKDDNYNNNCYKMFKNIQRTTIQWVHHFDSIDDETLNYCYAFYRNTGEVWEHALGITGLVQQNRYPDGVSFCYIFYNTSISRFDEAHPHISSAQRIEGIKKWLSYEFAHELGHFSGFEHPNSLGWQTMMNPLTEPLYYRFSEYDYDALRLAHYNR